MTDLVFNFRFIYWHLKVTYEYKVSFSFNKWIWKNRRWNVFTRPVHIRLEWRYLLSKFRGTHE